MFGYTLKSNLELSDIVGHAVIWILLTIVTFGLGLLVYPYYMARFIISKTRVEDENGLTVGRLSCTIDLASIVGNIVIWGILSILTLGLAYFVFLYKILAHCMNHTQIVETI